MYHLDFNFNIVVHFAEWRIYSVGEYHEKPNGDLEKMAYSYDTGFINPNLENTNINMTSAFKGFGQTTANLVLQPTSFVSEENYNEYYGYRVLTKGVDVGDTAN